MSGWRFLPNPGDEEEGLGHAGIETYKGSPYPGIARECSQNSLDAAVRAADGASQPVRLVFRHITLSPSEVPGLESLREALKDCLRHAEASGRKKEIDFFRRAVSSASQSKIPVLAVEDYGTTGLIGPSEPGRPFYALVKSSGVSQKAGPGAGGSFGIGKNAAFAISSLRTVFYSTLYGDGAKKVHLAQGKSILISHSNGAEKKRATGYWGAHGYGAVEGVEHIPPWLVRSEVGTTVASLGFVEQENWHWQVTESLVRNFFSAVNAGAVTFSVHSAAGDVLEITSETIPALFSQGEVLCAADDAGTSEDLQFSAAMFSALRSSETVSEERDFSNLGRFRLRLLQGDRLPKRVGILRNGMYICDNLKKFNHPLARFSLSRDFVGILEPIDHSACAMVREMENPKHDELSADRFDDLKAGNRIRRSMKEVGQWVRDLIKATTSRPTDAEVLLDEMNQFFCKPGDTAKIADPTQVNTDPERIKIVLKDGASRAVGSGPSGESGSSGGEKKAGSKGGRTTGASEGKGRGSQGGRGGRSIAFASLRNAVSSAGGAKVRLVSFTPEASGSALLELSAVGVSTDEPLALVSIDGKSCGKRPRISLEAGRRVQLSVEFDQAYVGPISLVLVRPEEGSNED